jgi:RNA polymerase sigma factor (sigma-70 family)
MEPTKPINTPRHEPSEGSTEMASDAFLLERWGAGDLRAGDRLIRRHFAAVHRYLRTKVANDAELEDLVQQTLLACVEARHHYRGEASFRTFLVAIARRRLFTHYAQSPAPTAPLSTGADAVTGVAQRLVRRQKLARVGRGIERLPRSMRTVLELSYWGELSVPAIAHRLGVPLNTAYSRLHRAKQALRDALTMTTRDA